MTNKYDDIKKLGKQKEIETPTVLLTLDELDADEVKPSLPIEKVLMNAGKNQKGRYFLVPLTVE